VLSPAGKWRPKKADRADRWSAARPALLPPGDDTHEAGWPPGLARSRAAPHAASEVFRTAPTGRSSDRAPDRSAKCARTAVSLHYNTAKTN
jgi:hypothetical protein